MGARTVGELLAKNPKIIGRQMANRGERKKLHFTMGFGEEVITNGVRTILVDLEDTRVHRTLLALLNSELLNWCFSLYSHTYNVKPYELFELPMPKLNDKRLRYYSQISDMLLFSMALSRKGDDEMEDAFGTFNDVMNASVYDIMLFDGIYRIIDLSSCHLHQTEFETWSKLSKAWSMDPEKALLEEIELIQKDSRDALISASQAIKNDRALSASIEDIRSEKWVRAVLE
jgi:hypothetical protein